MRTTLTLDDDVAAKLKAEARRSGRPFRDVVNEALRAGLMKRRASSPRTPFTLTARDLGNLKPGLSLDSIGDLLDQVEGPLRR
jgi:plasmid stability protein